MDKAEKVAFVSGLTGTSLAEIYLLFAVALLGVAVRHVGLIYSQRIRLLHQDSLIFAFLWEVSTIMVPVLASYTVLSNYVPLVLIFEVALITTLVFLSLNCPQTIQCNINDILDLPVPSRPAFVSVSRTYVNIATAIAIIAVDFHIFPRRFAKTETYGTGLMDTGVGLYILCQAGVSTEARYPPKENWTCPSLKLYAKSILKCMKEAAPFIILGMTRLVCIKSTDYQVHVSEYGVHWNFFFTIAAVKIIAVLLIPLVNLIPHLSSMLLPFVIGCLYQFILSYCGLREYVLYGPDHTFARDTFISANREGLFSCFGYLSLYFFGIVIGRQFFKSQRKQLRDYLTVLIQFASAGAVFIGATALLSILIEPVSRRLANITYIFWIASLFFLGISIAMCVDILVVSLRYLLSKPTVTSPLYQGLSPQVSSFICLISSIDYNQCVFFLLANVSTGLINFTIDTLSANSVMSFIVLFLHCAGLSVISITLKGLNIKLL